MNEMRKLRKLAATKSKIFRDPKMGHLNPLAEEEQRIVRDPDTSDALPPRPKQTKVKIPTRATAIRERVTRPVALLELKTGFLTHAVMT